MKGYTRGLDGGYYDSTNGELSAANTRYRQQEKQNELLERQNYTNYTNSYSYSNVTSISSDGLLFTILGLGNNDCGLFIFAMEFFFLLFILPITKQLMDIDLGYLNLYAEKGEPINFIIAFGIVYIISLLLYIVTHLNEYKK